MPLTFDLWPWKSIEFQTLLRTKYVPSLVKIHWRILILECSQGSYAVKIWPIDLWPWKSIRFQTLLRTMYVPSLVKIHWRMLILECSQGCYAVKIWPLDPWPWKSIGFQTPKDYVCTKFGQNSLKDVDSRVFTTMLQVKIWPGDIDLWPMTLKINRVPDSHKDYVCTQFGQNPLKDLDSRVFTRILCGKKLTPWPLTLKINRVPDSPKD